MCFGHVLPKYSAIKLSIFVTIHFEFAAIETEAVKLGVNSSLAPTSPVFAAPFEGVLAGSVLQEVSGIDFCTAQRGQRGMALTVHLYSQEACHP